MDALCRDRRGVRGEACSQVWVMMSCDHQPRLRFPTHIWLCSSPGPQFVAIRKTAAQDAVWLGLEDFPAIGYAQRLECIVIDVFQPLLLFGFFEAGVLFRRNKTCPARFDPIDTDLADPIPGDLMRPTDSGIEPSTLGCARKGLTVSPT